MRLTEGGSSAALLDLDYRFGLLVRILRHILKFHRLEGIQEGVRVIAEFLPKQNKIARLVYIATRCSLTPGFTLLELLVAVLLLSLIFLLLTSGLQFGTKIWSAGQENPGNIPAATVQQLLRRVFSEALPVMIEATPTERRHVFFVGTENSVRLIAPMPVRFGVGGLYEIAIYLTDGGEGVSRIAEAARGLMIVFIRVATRKPCATNSTMRI